MVLNLKYIAIGTLIWFGASRVFPQNNEYSPGKESPNGTFESYKIDSNNIGRLFYVNGKIKCEVGVIIKKSLFWKKIITEHGIWHYYDDKGLLREIGSYYNGKKNGMWLFFNDNRDIIKIKIYYKDKELPIG